MRGREVHSLGLMHMCEGVCPSSSEHLSWNPSGEGPPYEVCNNTQHAKHLRDDFPLHPTLPFIKSISRSLSWERGRESDGPWI